MANNWSTPLGTAGSPARSPRLVRPLAVLLAFTLAMTAGVVVGAEGASSAERPEVPVEPVAEDESAEADPIPEGHAAAIAAYWRDRDAAFARSPEDGVTFVASRLHPSLGYSVERCRRAWYPHGLPEHLRQRVVVDEGTVSPDPEWRMPHGPLHDTELASPVYRMHVQTVLSGMATGVDVDKTVAVHLAVIGGKAYGFSSCVEPTVARSIITRLTSPERAPLRLVDPSAPLPAPAPPAPAPVPAPPAPAPAPAPAPPPTPTPPPPPPAPAPVPIPAPVPPPAPQVPPPVVQPPPVTPPPPPPEQDLTLDEELTLVLSLIDGLLQAGWLSVDEAVDLLVELADAPELDDDQRALVESNLRLLWDYQDRPEGDLPRLNLSTEPDSTFTGPADWPLPDRQEPRPEECDVTLDELEEHREAVCER